MEGIVPCAVIGMLAGASAYAAMGAAAEGSRPFSLPRRPGVGVGGAAGLARRVGAAAGRLVPGAAMARVVLGTRSLLGGIPGVGGLADAELAGLAAVLSVLCGLAGALVALSPVGLVVGACLPAACLYAKGAAAQHARANMLEGAMPDAFSALGMALESGQSLAQAMRFVADREPEPIRSEFMRVSFSIACGVSATEALDTMITRLPVAGLDLVALALAVSQRTGAPLKGLLGDAARLAGSRIELKRRLDVKTSQARLSARMVALMPVAMMCTLSLLSEDFRRGLATVPGLASAAMAVALNVAAWSIIRKIMEVRI